MALLLDTARALDATALANYRVSADRLGDLEEALNQFSQKIGSPRATTIKRRTRTLSLEDLFSKLRTVHSRMDRLAVVLRSTAPDFLAAYESARVIIDRAATQEDVEQPQPLPPLCRVRLVDGRAGEPDERRNRQGIAQVAGEAIPYATTSVSNWLK